MFSRAALLVCDVQQRVVPHIRNSGRMLQKINTISQANQEYQRILNQQKISSRERRARGLVAPVVVAEFIPNKLGTTDSRVLAELPKTNRFVFEKPNYTMYNDRVDQLLKEREIDRVVLTGVQTEWCVTQTAKDFREAGYQVEVLQDAVGSSDEYEHLEALDRLKRSDIWVTTTHGWIVERLRTAEHPITQWYLNRLRENRMEDVVNG